MSPAASRRYAVGFKSWTVYETVVLADNRDEAIAKAQALYDRNGLGYFSTSPGSDEPWEAMELGGEVAS